ncbi:helicase-related protein [Candidatus Methanomassiliicoccus intestinalis]|uniref:helicase-related protein n=1 Tax=Candidatus Methanomassiliicoccus intestinalis TaxID=1406512 RepID=UPI0037DC2439
MNKMYVDHPLIKEETIQFRSYQRYLADSCLSASTLVVLPTGMGKTVVALMVAAEVMERKGGKVLFLAPTKPLVEQHSDFMEKSILCRAITTLTGEIMPEERELLWNSSDVIVSTPQVIANDLKQERISLENVSLIIFDEAHRAVGNYSYVLIAEEYAKISNGLVLGMTASPGSNAAKIMEVCNNLNIERIEIKTELDKDVSDFVHENYVDWIVVDLPKAIQEIANVLRTLYDRYIAELKLTGLMTPGRPATMSHLLDVQKEVQARLNSGEKNRKLYNALSVQARAVKVNHAIELIETQGVTPLSSYLKKIKEDAEDSKGSKASKAIVTSQEFEIVMEMVANAKMEHPKISRIMGVVSQQLNSRPESKVLVFTQYRDTCDMVVDYLSKIEGVRVSKLIGQSGRGSEKGLKQKEQLGVLQRFRDDEINVLVATSVGEEGLDVANTDLVVFYEPVPSEIRSIQRRGRTGRNRDGKVVVLMTAGTKDEVSQKSSDRKEQEMKKRLYALKKEWDAQKTGIQMRFEIN